MFMEKIKNLIIQNEDMPKNKKIENMVAFLVILIITVICINVIWKEDSSKSKGEEYKIDSNKKLADNLQAF